IVATRRSDFGRDPPVTVAGQCRTLTGLPRGATIRTLRPTPGGVKPDPRRARPGGSLAQVPRLVSTSDLQPPAPPTAKDLRPPARFAAATFDSYSPQHPTQEAARYRVREFVRNGGAAPARRLLPWPPRRPQRGAGLYLDRGFGVGKTHRLAAASGDAPAAAQLCLTPPHLVYPVGALGVQRAVEESAGTRLLCIDEFELDAPGNTLIVKSFLQALFAAGTAVV